MADPDLIIGSKEGVDPDDITGFIHWRQFWSALVRPKKVAIKDGDSGMAVTVMAMPRKGLLIIEDYPKPRNKHSALTLAAIYKEGWKTLGDANPLKGIIFALPKEISEEWDRRITSLKGTEPGEIEARAPPPPRPPTPRIQPIAQEDEGWWKVIPDTPFYDHVEESPAGELARAVGGSPKGIRLLERASDSDGEDCDPSGPYEVVAFEYVESEPEE